MGLLTAQLKQALRRLARAPMFTAVSLLTLAVGIGANTAMFSVVEGILLKPLPYPQPDRLVSAMHTAEGLNIKRLEASPSSYFTYREQGRAFEDIGIYQGDSVSVTGLAEPEQVRAEDVTDGVLPILGIPPMLGRWFSRGDDSPGAPDTVLLAYGYWSRKFGGDPSALGKTMIVDGKLRQIIGVMPRDFQFIDQPDVALILPLKLDRSKTLLGQFSYDGVARLKPGVTLEQANADVARMIPIMERSFPAPPGFSLKLFEDAGIGPNVRPLKQDVVGDIGKVLWVLTGGIGLVLLIACANVANLLLVRAEGRQQELAIRAAMGASRRRLIAEMWFESLLLAVLGAVLGLGLAYAGQRLLVAMAPTGLPRLHEIGIDGAVLAFTLALAFLASLLFGSIPAFKYSNRGLGTGLREGGRSLSESRERHRARAILVAVQVALAVVLLVSSGLMIRTFGALTKVEPGFSAPSAVQTFRLAIPETLVKDPEQVARMQEEMLHKLQALPGVTSAALSVGVPMDANRWQDPVFAQDRTYSPGDLPLRRFKFVAPGYFKTLGTPLLAGRDFTWEDQYNKLPVAIVSANLAREYWHDPAAALGKQIRVSTKDDWREIVGVAGDVHDDGMDKEPPSSVYWPILVSHFEGNSGVEVRRFVTFSLRSRRAGSQSLMNEARQTVWSVNPNLPLADVHTLDYFYTRSMARTSFTLVMLAVAGGMALLLGIVGLYGVIACSVSQRRREIGIRMALGARERELVGMFVRHALGLAGLGVAGGLAAALALTRLMSSLLFGVKPSDPATYAAVSLGLIATAALSSYLPARRAAAVNPVESLRAE